MASALEVARARLKRAEEHFQGLRALHDSLINENFCRSGLEIQRPKSGRLGRIVAKVQGIEEFPARYTIAIGNIAHQMRAALDNLAFAIVKPSPGRERSVYFPICESPAKFRELALRMLPGASIRVRAAFERLQPYRRRKRPKARYLLHLNALINWDKHRAIALCALNGIVAGVHVSVDSRFEIVRRKFFPLRHMTAGTALTVFHYRTKPDTPKGTTGYVKMNPDVKIVVDSPMQRPHRWLGRTSYGSSTPVEVQIRDNSLTRKAAWRTHPPNGEPSMGAGHA